MNIFQNSADERKNQVLVVLSYVRAEHSKICRTSEAVNNTFHNAILSLMPERIIYYARRKYETDLLKLCYDKIREVLTLILNNWESYNTPQRPKFIEDSILTLHEYLEIIKIEPVKEWIQAQHVDKSKVEYVNVAEPTDDDLKGIIYKWVVETGMNEDIKNKVWEMFNIQFE